MSSGEMVAQARSRALPPLVGDLNVESEVLRRVLHAEAVDDGQGEQLDVLICKGLPGLGELGDRLVEQGTDVVLGITCGSGDGL
ncbi:hypothetical protein [Actinoplanes utahensis]|uniref:Uncharacterized protein n=1 Tax=Actinoplanes utahensis TaxID=1869 RepID=A0A0A6ULP7_ACTUT|nr:hypothetical protein [Actinoplanes utahensis]KHD75998.1 hypothetical protein MB27_19085 [Actinoplanes utahensis]GIF35516.1 hypothetical protein Aut01nite_85020 [Actinoplanes utahensis]